MCRASVCLRLISLMNEPTKCCVRMLIRSATNDYLPFWFIRLTLFIKWLNINFIRFKNIFIPYLHVDSGAQSRHVAHMLHLDSSSVEPTVKWYFSCFSWPCANTAFCTSLIHLSRCRYTTFTRPTACCVNICVLLCTEFKCMRIHIKEGTFSRSKSPFKGNNLCLLLWKRLQFSRWAKQHGQ